MCTNDAQPPPSPITPQALRPAAGRCQCLGRDCQLRPYSKRRIGAGRNSRSLYEDGDNAADEIRSQAIGQSIKLTLAQARLKKSSHHRRYERSPHTLPAATDYSDRLNRDQLDKSILLASSFGGLLLGQQGTQRINVMDKLEHFSCVLIPAPQRDPQPPKAKTYSSGNGQREGKKYRDVRAYLRRCLGISRISTRYLECLYLNQTGEC